MATVGQFKVAKDTPLQARAVRAVATALEGERRVFYGSPPQWGLPRTPQE